MRSERQSKSQGVALARIASFVIIAGFAYSGEDFIRLVITAVALPVAGAALSAVPTIGGNLAAIMGNVAIAVGGILVTRIIIRLYEIVVGDIKSLGN